MYVTIMSAPFNQLLVPSYSSRSKGRLAKLNIHSVMLLQGGHKDHGHTIR